MQPNSQRDTVPILPGTSRGIADPEEIQLRQFWHQLCLRYRRGKHSDFSRLWPSPGLPSGSRTVSNRQALTWSESDRQIRFTPFIRVRYPSLLGHRFGAYPSPCGTRSSASLRAPAGFGSSRNKFAPKPAKNAERICSGSLRKSRPSALGSRAHSRGFAMCDPSKFGNSKRRTEMYLNRITLIGFLGSDVEVRTANNSTLAVLSLATKSSYKDKKTGEYVSHTEWHRAIVWGKLAEYAKTLTKGSHLQIEGELRSREYQDKKNGNAKRRVWEVRVDSLLKLDRAERASAEDAAAVPEPEEVPF